MFSSPAPELWPAPLRPIAALGGVTLEAVSALGRFGRFFAQAVGYVVIPPFKIGRLIDRIHFIGFRSLILVILAGAFTGMDADERGPEADEVDAVDQTADLEG